MQILKKNWLDVVDILIGIILALSSHVFNSKVGIIVGIWCFVQVIAFVRQFLISKRKLTIFLAVINFVSGVLLVINIFPDQISYIYFLIAIILLNSAYLFNHTFDIAFRDYRSMILSSLFLLSAVLLIFYPWLKDSLSIKLVALNIILSGLLNIFISYKDQK